MLRHFMGLGGLVLAGVLTLGACNSDDKPADETPPDPYPNFDKFCDAIAKVQCVEPIQKACALNGTGTGDACISEVSNGCKSKTIELTRNVKDSANNYHKDKAAECIAAVGAVYAAVTTQITSANHASIQTACQPTFQGNLTKGFPCDDTTDCSPGLGCYRPNVEDKQGTCQTITTKTATDSCDAVGDVCADGLYCAELTNGGKVCVKGNGDGGKCSAALPCQSGFVCGNIDATTNQGTCAAKKTSGVNSTCSLDSDCVSNYCVQYPDGKFACLDYAPVSVGSVVCEGFDGQ